MPVILLETCCNAPVDDEYNGFILYAGGPQRAVCSSWGKQKRETFDDQKNLGGALVWSNVYWAAVIENTNACDFVATD